MARICFVQILLCWSGGNYPLPNFQQVKRQFYVEMCRDCLYSAVARSKNEQKYGMKLREKDSCENPPRLNTNSQTPVTSYDPAMTMFIKPFLAENANGGFNVKLLACLCG